MAYDKLPAMHLFQTLMFLLTLLFRLGMLQAYPLIIHFAYVPGVMYDVSTTDKYISVVAPEHVALQYPIPDGCNRKTLRATKKTPYLTLRMECEEEPKTVLSYYSVDNLVVPLLPTLEKSNTHLLDDYSFSI